MFQLTGLSVSSGSDQLIVFHLTDCNDLAVCLVTVSVNWYIIDIILFQLTGLSVSSGSDQLIVFHLTDGNDLVVCLVTVSVN